MSNYRIVLQHEQADGSYTEGESIHTGSIHHPITILQLGLRHSTQIAIIRKLQTALLNHQSIDLQEAIEYCPKCGYEVIRNGIKSSNFSSVFTDHKVPIHKLKCTACGWESVPSVKSLFGTHLHPDLVKLQCEHGSHESYSHAEQMLNRFCDGKRSVNNTMSVRDVVEMVGNHISARPETQIADDVEKAKELIVQVDGGHVKSKMSDERSFEALTSIIYSPEAVIAGKKRRQTGRIQSKHCAASALDDHGEHINQLTLVAALKEGMTEQTHLTALCDGAINCWNVIESLQPYCASIESILDWFHIAKKFQNTRLGDPVRNFSLARAKWCFWHHNLEKGFAKLNTLKAQLTQSVLKEKVDALITYLDKNRDKLIDYDERYNAGKVISSQMAESTVESLINQRCKGKRHMQWSRKGLHPVLQLRAAVASNDWQIHWEKYILDAYDKAA